MANKQAGTGMTLIVKTVTRITVGLILVYGLYIVLQGHLSPGGGFAGGVIIALSFIHLMLAFGKDAVVQKLNQKRGVLIMSLAALVFLFLMRLEFVSRHAVPGSREGYFKLLSAGLIPLCEIAVAFMVGAGLFIVFLALVLSTGERGEQ